MVTMGYLWVPRFVDGVWPPGPCGGVFTGSEIDFIDAPILRRNLRASKAHQTIHRQTILGQNLASTGSAEMPAGVQRSWPWREDLSAPGIVLATSFVK